VVGPDGCGKSTLLSSIPWGVWGNSENVTFRGTHHRPQSDTARVTLEWTGGEGAQNLTRTAHSNGVQTLEIDGHDISPDTPTPLRLAVRTIGSLDELTLIRHSPEFAETLLIDELENDLGDMNIDWFASLVADLGTTYQVVIATHSKKVMSTADQITGVGMKEYGVSSLLDF